jgi:hypothetical protein
MEPGEFITSTSRILHVLPDIMQNTAPEGNTYLFNQIAAITELYLDPTKKNNAERLQETSVDDHRKSLMDISLVMGPATDGEYQFLVTDFAVLGLMRDLIDKIIELNQNN